MVLAIDQEKTTQVDNKNPAISSKNQRGVEMEMIADLYMMTNQEQTNLPLTICQGNVPVTPENAGFSTVLVVAGMLAAVDFCMSHDQCASGTPIVLTEGVHLITLL